MNREPKHTTTPLARSLARRSWLLCPLLLLLGCGAGPRPAAAPPCDQSCQDGVALLGLRSAMKFAYNYKIATQPVGAQDAMTPCYSEDGSHGGTVHIFGDASVNAIQGASIVSLSYDFENCLFSAPPDPTADQNFSLTLTGLVTETGTLSVQPTATTALDLESDSVSVSGTVYDPAVQYSISNCALSVLQNGNAVSGALCGRSAGFIF
jgi:hypothetical protein